ncbi:hypothetical protein GCM10023223_20630 [Stackebrandtia albiflava]
MEADSDRTPRPAVPRTRHEATTIANTRTTGADGCVVHVRIDTTSFASTVTQSTVHGNGRAVVERHAEAGDSGSHSRNDRSDIRRVTKPRHARFARYSYT